MITAARQSAPQGVQATAGYHEAQRRLAAASDAHSPGTGRLG
jgi:hypothetical protein